MITFETKNDGSGLEVVDRLERRHYTLSLPDAATPVSVETDSFLFPVDAGVKVTTSEVTLPTVHPVCLRDEHGNMLTEARHFLFETFPERAYSIELCTPIKMYLRVESSVTLSVDTERTYLEFGESTEVFIGARSKHEQPAGTIVVPDDPEAMFAAISTFGSALKTTSPERSYPTLRGHPPLIERGSCLDIPDDLVSSETGIRLELPATYRHAYVAAPLAYYLGADLVATDSLDDEPQLVTDTGFTHTLSSPQGFERECERVLKQVFFLDCLTRTEGLYKIDLYERRVLEDELAIDFADLYDQSIGEQLQTYLSVPFDTIRTQLPDWKLTTHVTPDPQYVETLPFLVNDLAVIRTPTKTEAITSGTEITAVDEFLRDSFVRSAGVAVAPETNYVQPEQTDSLEHAWVGDEIPLGASKVIPEAYHNRLDRSLSGDAIGITVVCNDAKMAEERDLVDSAYGAREELPFEVSAHRELTTDDLANLLSEPTDFLHYIGHIDAEGFECADGKLDVSSLETVGVDAFFLNACQSYDQGVHLIEAGAIGGIATLNNVVNSGAVTIGGAIARLLNCGFPLRAALEVAKNESVIGNQYIVLGDGGLAIAQPEGGTPYVCDISRSDDGFLVDITGYVNSLDGMGSLLIPYIGDNESYFLNSGLIESFDITTDELKEFLNLDVVPVRNQNQLYWSDEFKISEI